MKNSEFYEKAEELRDKNSKDELIRSILKYLIGEWFNNNNELPPPHEFRINVNIPASRISEVIELLTELNYFNNSRPAGAYEVVFGEATLMITESGSTESFGPIFFRHKSIVQDTK